MALRGAALPWIRSWRAQNAESRGAKSHGLDSLEPVLSLIIKLLIWALIFGLFVSIAPKKQDRYVLPAICALVLASGLALHTLLLRWLRNRVWSSKTETVGDGERVQGWSISGPWAALLPAILISSIAAVYAFSSFVQPYPLAHYNPLLGGAKSAEKLVLVGWGEGYDLAAGYLNRLPDVDVSKVSAASPGKANMAPLFDGVTRSLAGYEPGRTDYVVMYRSQVQRRKPTADDKNPLLLHAYYDDPAIEPDFVGRIAGVDMVWVYRNITVRALEERMDELAREGDLIVAGGETVFAKHYDGPLSLHRYWGHWAEEDIERELIPSLDAGWERIWVLRYPNYDPPATLMALEEIARRGQTHPIDFRDGSRVEITEFVRR